ncbi:MAG TPA: response regulator [Gemmatimonadaceae bacterium]|nr:response regulator [Gemmatimonadaceae bacterium]
MLTDDALATLLRSTFAVELAEQAHALSAEALALDHTPADVDRVRSLFRTAHTLKGAAGAAGILPVSRVCHALEDRLALARDGTRPLGPGDVALLLEVADALGATSELLRAGMKVDEASLETLEERAKASARRRATPSLDTAGAVPAPPPPVATAAPPPPNTVRVAADKLDALLAASGALLALRTSLELRRDELEGLYEEAWRWMRIWPRAARALRAELARRGARGGLGRSLQALDEHFRTSTRTIARLSEQLARDTHAMTQAVSETSYRVQQLRMRPFREACARLPRAVHDAAIATGREVRLVVEDGGVELDRTIVDGLADALLPLVRNAVDHGIEGPDIRERLGKPRVGTITVRAGLEGDRVQITVADDGSGVNETAVREALARRGLAVPETPEAIADAILRLTVSTRTEVSEISGRGVGVDIVVSAMRRIHGTIRVAWEVGRGTTFTLQCPPSLATLNVVVVAVGDHLLALPTGSVARVARLTDADIRMVGGRPTLTSPEGAIPLASLAVLLGPPLAAKRESGPRHVVVLGPVRRRLAVSVDAVLGAHEAVMRPVERGGETLPLVAGVMLLGNGRLAVVLTSSAIVEAGLAPGVATGIEAVPQRPQAARARVLVVDDSITTRTLEASVLEAAGYDVITAVDGADGWRRLQVERVDLVVSDVEMPKMDGFDLCRAIRGAPRLGRLPIVLVTALESAEHRANGLEVGADAYIGKSTFEQDALLNVVRQLLGEGPHE